MQYLEALYLRARGVSMPPDKLAMIKIKKRAKKKDASLHADAGPSRPTADVGPSAEPHVGFFSFGLLYCCIVVLLFCSFVVL